MPKCFTADLRMWRHSGIGRYLQNLTPLLLPQLRCERIRLIGQAHLIGDAAWLRDERVEFVEESARVYSLAEQTMAARGRFRGSSLLWVPHFNVPLLYGGRLMVTMHDIAPLVLPEILGNQIKRAYAKLLIERGANCATAIVSVSEFTKSELVQRLGVDAAKIHVASPGLDAAWPRKAQPHMEADGAPYVLFVGNVKPNKNLRLLVRALAAVQKRTPLRLLIAGRIEGLGTGDEDVIREARSLGERVRFLGEVSDQVLHALYAGAAALCVPSKYEGFGLTLLEAMALGCPVLASSAASLPEVGGEAPLYFSPDSEAELSACLLRCTDEAFRNTSVVKGYARVKQFSFERCAAQTAAVMNACMESR